MTPEASPQCEVSTPEMYDDDEEEAEDDQNQDRLSGSSSPQSPRELRWALSAKMNGLSPSGICDDPSPLKEEPQLDLSSGLFQRYRPEEVEEERDSDTEVARPPRLEGWALDHLHQRGLEVGHGRVNLSLLEQAIALQTEQRQVLHHAYREMDRFLMEQMTNERRHQRMMDMDNRISCHSGKGKTEGAIFGPNSSLSSGSVCQIH